VPIHPCKILVPYGMQSDRVQSPLCYDQVKISVASRVRGASVNRPMAASVVKIDFIDVAKIVLP
jgi:hypothetical protein